MKERKYWLTIANSRNCAILSGLGFPFYAMGRMARRPAQAMQVGDLCTLYRAGERKGFIGVFEVTEGAKELPTSLGHQTFPMRMLWKMLVLCEDAPVPAGRLASDLDFIKNKKHYGTYFQMSVKRLSESDFKLIEQEVNASAMLRTRGGTE